jgi:ACS family glucarate transporter-like MFS transporter
MANIDRPSTNALDNNQQDPTSIRFLVVLVTFLAAFLLYLHRFSMSYAQQYIKEDLRLTDDQIAFCFSAFFLAYALAQVPSGWMSDRFGARVMLSVYILVWSLFTGLMGLTTGFVMLLVMRMAAGLGQAGAYPTSAGLLSKWVPLRRRGTANGCVAFGGRLGGGLAPILTVGAIVAFVPTSVSSRLVPDDLMDPHHLCFQLAGDSETVSSFRSRHDFQETPRDRLGWRIYGLLSSDSKQIVSQLAGEYTQAWEKRAEADESNEIKPGKYVPSNSLLLTPPPKEQSERILQSLNALLTGPALAQQDEFQPDFEEIPKEREARKLAARSEPLSTDERERLNRLLLEATFPDSIKKVYVHGWRPVMFVYGSLGLIVAGLFWFCFRNRPNQHPWINSAEVALIDEGRPKSIAQTEKKIRPVPIKHIIKSRSLWLMCLNQWGANIGWVFLVTWLPRYLREVHEVSFVQGGLLAAIPLWVGWAGMLLGGWVTDHIVGRFGLRFRVLPIAMARFLAMIAYLSCLLHPSVWTVTAIFAVVAFTCDLSNPAAWAYKQDVGDDDVGSIHGWANMWGNLGATISPILLQFVIKTYSWDAAFLTCAGAFLIASVAAMGVDARIPIVPLEEGKLKIEN